MQLRSKVNHHAAEYFRKNLQVPSTNISDSNVSFPYKHKFFTGLNKLPFLSSEPKLINIPISQGIIQGYYTASFEELDCVNVNSFPRHSVGLSMSSIDTKNEIYKQVDLKKDLKAHLMPDDLSLIDENTINSYNKLVSDERRSQSPQRIHGTIQREDHTTNNQMILSHPNKPGVTATSILEVVPLDIESSSIFQIMLDSNDEDNDTLLELQDGWKYPTTRFSFYKKCGDNIYKYQRDYASNLSKENFESYVISLPRYFLEEKVEKNRCNETEVSSAHIFATRAPKILLSKVSSVKKKSKIKFS